MTARYKLFSKIFGNSANIVSKSEVEDYLLTLVTPGGEAQASHQHSLTSSVMGNPFQLQFILFLLASNSWRRISFTIPLFSFPSRFQVSAFLMMHFDDFQNVCLIHFQHLSFHFWMEAGLFSFRVDCY